MKALVLFSGGVDSSTCLGMAVSRYGAENVVALSVQYGQKHEKEVEAAKDAGFQVLTLGRRILRTETAADFRFQRLSSFETVGTGDSAGILCGADRCYGGRAGIYLCAFPKRIVSVFRSQRVSVKGLQCDFIRRSQR